MEKKNTQQAMNRSYKDKDRWDARKQTQETRMRWKGQCHSGFEPVATKK